MKFVVKFFPYIVAAILGALIAWMIIPRGSNEKSILQDNRAHYQKVADSLHLVTKALAKKDTLQSRIVVQTKQEKLKAQKDAIYWKTKYEKSQNTPVVHWTDKQLDSLVDVLLRRRQH